MTSDARITANGRNAVLSTGPKSPEGKAISSRNATKHGITAARLAASVELPRCPR